MALVNLDVEFADSHDSDRKNCRVENCDGLKTCLVQLLDSRSPDTEWLVSWLKENVGSRDRRDPKLPCFENYVKPKIILPL